MRILLVQPAPFEPGRLGLENVTWLSEPVGLTALAAMVPEHEVRLLDLRLEPDVVYNQTLLEFRPDLVGTTAMTTDCYQAQALLAIAKRTLGDGVFTLAGGHHPTMASELYEDESVDAICLGEGEETFQQLVAHLAAGKDRTDLGRIAGLKYKTARGYEQTPKRSQNRELDQFPAPARHLIPQRYREQYFFTIANPMASMFTSRGCSFSCNFCAIWEFYERRTRFLSAKTICDRMEQIEEKFIFLLDDNFLTNRRRLEELCAEIERRGIKKYFGTQGRADFIAENPELMRRLRDAGLVMVLSGYESNDDDALEALRKASTYQANLDAARILRELGIVSTGIFMVRPEFEEQDFDRLYQTINEMQIIIPLVTVLTPLPGTELWRKKRSELLTEDMRLYDLLHAVTPTRLPRADFYRKFTEWNRATWPGFQKGLLATLRRRPGFFLQALPGTIRFLKRAQRYRAILESPESHLRDEIGIIPSDVTLDSVKQSKLPILEAV